MATFGNASLVTLPNTTEFAGYEVSPVDRFRYAAQDAWAQGPFATAMDYYKVQKLREERGPIAGTSVADLKKKYANTSMANTDWTKFTNNRGEVSEALEQYLYNRRVEQALMQERMRGAYDSVGSGAISFAGSIAGSLLDPINLATAMVPMSGISGLAGKMIARTAPKWGTGVVASAAAGAAENALIAGTMIEPFTGVLRNRLDDPYTMQDYWTNIGMSALLGAGFGAVGGVFDPMGMRYVNQYKQAVLNDNVKKMSNASAELQDAAIALKVDAELKGNSASNINKMFEYDNSMKYSNITPAERQHAMLATTIEEAGDTAGQRVRLAKAKKINKGGKLDHYEVSAQVDGKTLTGTGSTAKQAYADLNQQAHNRLKQYQPTFTKQGDMWVAQYTRDTGVAKELTGAGRTKAQALRELNNRYTELVDGMPDIEKLREDISASDPARREQYEAWKAEKMAQLELDENLYREGFLSKKEYNARTRAIEKQIKEWDTDFDIYNENLSNYHKSSYDRQMVESPEVLQQRALEIANDKPDGIVQENKNIQARNEQAEIVTQTDNTLRTFNDDNEARIFESELYENLTQTQKELVNENYAQAKSDAEIMNSGKVAEIMDRYISCRKGL